MLADPRQPFVNDENLGCKAPLLRPRALAELYAAVGIGVATSRFTLRVKVDCLR
jgi:hypothetical protein